MRTEVILTLIGMGIVTYFTRSFFIVFLNGEVLPPFVKRWLGFVPVAVLTAIIAPIIIAPGGKLHLTYDSPYLIAGVFTAVVAAVSKNLIITVISGIAFIVLVKFLLG